MSPTSPQQPAPPSRATGKLAVAIGLAIAAAVLAITWKSGQPTAPVLTSDAEDSQGAVPASPRRTTVGPPHSAAAATAVPPTPEQVQQRLLDVEKKRAAESEAAQRYWVDGFAAQSVDASWSQQKEEEVRKIVEADDFDAYGVSPKDLRIECRSSLCKVTATFASQDKAEDWMRAFMLKTAQGFSGGATQTVKQPNGESTVRIITSARR